MLKTRVKTAAVLILLAAVLLYFSRIPAVMEAAAAILGVIAVWELYGVGGYERRSILFVLSALIAAALPFLPIPDYAPVLAPILLAGGLCFGWEARDLSRFALFGRGTAFVFSLIVTAFFRAFPALRAGEYGLFDLLLTVAACVVTDTGAYFVGRALGKHKLAPHVSPGKSVEGAVGGTALACILVPLLGLAFARGAAIGFHPGRALLFALTASLLGQAGDLSFSVLKRIAGAKDYGTLMPGHGGVLDRFDSMLFAVPYALLFIRVLPLFD